MVIENGAALLKHLDIATDKVPDRGVLSDEAQGEFLASSADHKGRIRLLHWLWLTIRLFDLIVFALKGRRGFRPHAFDDLARLAHTADALTSSVERNAIGIMFPLV